MAGELKTNIVIALINNVTAPLKEITNNFEALRAAGKQASAAFDWGMRLNQSAEGARRLSNSIRALTAEPLKLAESEETALVGLQRSTGLSAEAFAKLKTQMVGLGSGTEFTGAGVAGGLTAMVNSGMDATAAIGQLKHVMDLASVAHMPLAQASGVTVEILKKFGGTAEQTGLYVDMLAKAGALAPKAGLAGIATAMQDVADTAARFHVPFQTALGLVTEFTKSSGSAEKASGAFATMYSHVTKRLGEAQIQKAFGYLADLGINIKTGVKDVPALLAEVTAKTAGLSDVARGRAFQMIFGDAAIASMIKVSGPAGLGAVNEALGQAEGSMKAAADLEDSSAAQAHERYEAATKRLGEALGASLVPGAKRWDNLMTSLIGGTADLAKNHETLTSIVMTSTKVVGYAAGAVTGVVSAASGLASVFAVINGVAGAGKTTALIAKLIPALNLAKLASLGLQGGLIGAAAALGAGLGTAIDQYLLKPLWDVDPDKQRKENEVDKGDLDQKALALADLRRRAKAAPLAPLVPLGGGTEGGRGQLDVRVKVDQDGRVKGVTTSTAGDMPINTLGTAMAW